MRSFSIFLGILVCSFGAAAQDNSSSALQPAAPSFGVAGSNAAAPSVSAIAAGSIIPASSSTVPFTPATPNGFSATSAPSSPEPAPPLQGAVAVYETYSWQLAADYAFLRFYEVPGVQKNYWQGLIVTGNYYFKNWLAAEGEFMATGGDTQSNVESHVAFGGGGPRFRWSGPRNIELFGHALFGHAHFVPQTPFGSQGAFAYVLGGGVDINAHHRRFAYRVGADMLGTHFFGTNQFSPRAYVGFVFKF
jgi:hypothetical protein